MFAEDLFYRPIHVYLAIRARVSLADLDHIGTKAGSTQNSNPQVAQLDLGGQLARKAFRWQGVVRSDMSIRDRRNAALSRLEKIFANDLRSVATQQST